MTEAIGQRESPLPKSKPMLLSFVAGYVDSYTYLALFGLFAAQVTGSFVIAGAEFVTHDYGIAGKLRDRGLPGRRRFDWRPSSRWRAAAAAPCCRSCSSKQRCLRRSPRLSCSAPRSRMRAIGTASPPACSPARNVWHRCATAARSISTAERVKDAATTSLAAVSPQPPRRSGAARICRGARTACDRAFDHARLSRRRRRGRCRIRPDRRARRRPRRRHRRRARAMDAGAGIAVDSRRYCCLPLKGGRANIPPCAQIGASHAGTSRSDPRR